MDEIRLLKEIVDLKESLEWFNEELGRSKRYVLQLKGQAEHLHERILELKDQVANADMTRRYLRQENLRLEKRLFELMEGAARDRGEIERLNRMLLNALEVVLLEE